jgi:signal transduction histidine kinase
MTLFGITALTTALFSFVLSIFVYIKNPKKLVNKTWSAVTSATGLWAFGQFMRDIAFSNDFAYFWGGQILYTGMIFIPVFFLHFIIAFLDKISIKKNILFIGYFLSIIFLILTWTTKLIIKDMAPKLSFRYYTVPGILNFPLFLIFAYFVGYSYFLLFYNYNKFSYTKREQLRYIIIATIIGFLGGITSFLPVFNIPVFPYGNYFVILYAFIISYAIIIHRLLDIRIVIARIVIFLFVYFFVLWIPFWLGYQIMKTWGLWLIPVVVTIILMAIGPIIFHYLRKFTENRILAQKRMEQTALIAYSQQILALKTPEQLFSEIIDGVMNIFTPLFSAVYILIKEPQPQYQLKHSNGSLPNNLIDRIAITDPVISYLNDEQSPVVFADLIKASLISNLPPETLLIPFARNEQLNGFLVIGPRINNQTWDTDDLANCAIYGTNITFALENAFLHRQEQEKEARIQMLTRQERIAHLSSSVGHALNNKFNQIVIPLDTFLINIEFDPADDSGKLIQQRYYELKELVRGVISTAKVGAQISQQIMSSARLAIVAQAISAEKIIQCGILISQLKWGPGLKIVEDFDQNPKLIWFIPAFLEDCVINAGNNSTDAIREKLEQIRGEKLNSPDYSGEIILRTRYDDNFAYLEIKDNGMGIREEKLKQVGTVFYSSKYDAGKGTGLGVYSIIQQIQSVGGRVEIESVYTQGTTVRMILPLAKAM